MSKKLSIPTEIKSNSYDAETRSFEAVLSDERVDRDGEIIRQKAWVENIDTFMKNPQMLYSHNPFIPPIGRWEDLEIGKNGGPTVAKGVFRPEGDDPLTDNVAKAVATGFLTTVSVGFRSLKRKPPERDEEGRQVAPGEILKAELLEASLVNIPSNVGAAVRMAKALAINEFVEGRTKTIYSAPTDLEVIKRAGVLLDEFGKQMLAGKSLDAETISALEDLRVRVVSLASTRGDDEGKTKAALQDLRDLIRSI